MWEVIRRVLKKGGDINERRRPRQGAAGEPHVVSVYGGDASTVGTYTLDPKTHSVIKRGMGVFEYKGGKVTPEGVLRHRRRGLQEGLTGSSGGGEAVGFPATVPRPPARASRSRSVLLAVTGTSRRSLSSRSTAFFRCAYGLLGVGFALILGVTGRFHFAYGFTYTFAAYMAFTFRDRAGLPFWPASVLGILTSRRSSASASSGSSTGHSPCEPGRQRSSRSSSRRSASASPARTSSALFWSSQSQALAVVRPIHARRVAHLEGQLPELRRLPGGQRGLARLDPGRAPAVHDASGVRSRPRG